MDDRDLYGPDFFLNDLPAVASSAARAVPFLLEIVPGVTSVIDYGCGIGTWLREFAARGIEVVGVDGAHVDQDLLQIDRRSFVTMDLRNPTPVRDEPFDLAICLEVAEHLPERSGEQLVETLCRSAEVVVFGAAVPPQDDAVGGTGHINLHWQSYWAGLFARHGLHPDDRLRVELWDDHPDVTYHYPQNALIYWPTRHPHGPLDVVHPELAGVLTYRPRTLGQAARELPGLVRASATSRWGRIRRGRTPT